MYKRTRMLELFSADDHLIEPPNLWRDRLPSHYRDIGPRVEASEGIEYWRFESHQVPVRDMAGASPAARSKVNSNEALCPRPDRYQDMVPACFDPMERAQEMLSMGVVASVCFPSFPRFAGVRFVEFEDQKLAELCVRAYNDFIFDEWCPGGPEGMFVPMIIVPLWDPEKAAREIYQSADRGSRAVSLPENTVPVGLPSYYTSHWDPVWRACEETETVVCMHIGTSGHRYIPSPEAPNVVPVTLTPGVGCQVSLVNLLFSPVCHKFPNVKIVLSESGIGWVPYALERADLVWERYHLEEDLPNPMRPSEVWRNNMFVCQVEERVGLKNLDELGSEKVMWELDFPHPDTVWPFAQEAASRVFAEASLSDATVEQITHRNSERIFRWTPTQLPR